MMTRCRSSQDRCNGVTCISRRRRHRRSPREMDAFLAWIESLDRPLESIAKAALAHLWFLTIHPFADGNGRIGRAIADLILARGATNTTAYVSLSGQILKERTQYYAALESAQRGALDVTQWVIWFAGCYERASEATFALIEELLSAAAFWRAHATTDFNARQRKILQRYLAGGFEGWLNSSKYSKMADCSQDTAQRDLADLLARGVIIANDGSARRTSYRLPSEFDPNLRRLAPSVDRRKPLCYRTRWSSRVRLTCTSSSLSCVHCSG